MPLREWTIIGMKAPQPQTIADPPNQRTETTQTIVKEEPASVQTAARAWRTICKNILDRVTRAPDTAFRAPSKLLWGVRSRGYRQLLGGAL